MPGKEKKKKKRESRVQSCETCEFYEEDQSGVPSCLVSLDEDEFADFVARNTMTCPYFRFYDEYATVRKQN